jgi:hypothetical protein
MLLALVVGALTASPAAADILLETADLANTGQSLGYSLDGGQYLGNRFVFEAETTIECLGGHFQADNEEPFFAAIVPLDDTNDLPNNKPLGDESIYTVLMPGVNPSEDVLVQANVTLPAGVYGLIFGSQEYGATGFGSMPWTGQTQTGDVSGFYSGYSDWNQSSGTPRRFVIANGADCAGAVAPPPPAGEISDSVPVPVMSAWAQILMVLALGLIAVTTLRRLS